MKSGLSELAGRPKLYQLNFLAEYHDRMRSLVGRVPADIPTGIAVIEFDARSGQEPRYASGFLAMKDCTREQLAEYGLSAAAADSIIKKAETQNLKAGVWTILSELSDQGRSYFFLQVRFEPTKLRKFNPYQAGRVLN